jgi:hypothetical protein
MWISDRRRSPLSTRRTVVLTADELALAEKKFGPIFACRLSLFVLDHEQRRGFVVWDASWVGGSLKLRREGSDWEGRDGVGLDYLASWFQSCTPPAHKTLAQRLHYLRPERLPPHAAPTSALSTCLRTQHLPPPAAPAPARLWPPMSLASCVLYRGPRRKFLKKSC